MKRNERLFAAIALAAMLALALGASFVAALPSAPTSLTTGSSSSRNTTNLPAQSVSAQGGNVTEVNINALTQTTVWQGYYGNITGRITLDNANNFTFYNWSLTSVTGEVYATRNSTINWSGANCTNVTQRNAEDTYLGRVAADGDSAVNTYNLTTHAAVTVGAKTIPSNTCYSTNGYTNNASQSANWSMILLNDGINIVYTSIIYDNVVGFDGSTHDFEMLVGENENAGNIGVTPYYFWVELG